MINVVTISERQSLGILALTGFSIILQASPAKAQHAINSPTNRSVHEKVQTATLPLKRRRKVKYDAYILGPGDRLEIEVLDLPELSGQFSVGPDGTLYLPRLRAIDVEGLTIEELRIFLTEQFKSYVREPEVYVRPTGYRPIRVYISGEVQRPGFYTLREFQSITKINIDSQSFDQNRQSTQPAISSRQNLNLIPTTEDTLSSKPLPTVFDAIRIAQGITPYSDLNKVQVTRKRPDGMGGGHIRTNLSLLSLITKGDESQNIRLVDGDVLTISKSPVVLMDQLINAARSNLSPQFFKVFITGRVNIPGGVTVPQGSSLNQAISLAGGSKFLKGKIEFIRLNRDGTIDKRVFSYRSGAAANSPNNPVLAPGDLIRVRNSFLSGGAEILNELALPFVGLNSLNTLFKGFN